MGLSIWAAEVDALYADDPSGFVAGRTALIAQMKAAGEREAAAAVAVLRRPSLGAWYANLAARTSLVSLREWLALGAEIREAQARLDLRRVGELGSGRAALEARVIRDLTAHLAALGIDASAAGMDELRGTLRAALADPAAAAALAAGRLERSLSYAGFGEVDVSAALAASTTTLPVAEPAASAAGTMTSRSPADTTPDGASPAQDAAARARHTAQAEALARRNLAQAAWEQRATQVATAAQATEAAMRTRARASADVEAAERSLRTAQERLTTAAAQLGDASRALTTAQQAERDAEADRQRAAAELRAAERALDNP